jgi:hypothetical protein
MDIDSQWFYQFSHSYQCIIAASHAIASQGDQVLLTVMITDISILLTYCPQAIL